MAILLKGGPSVGRTSFDAEVVRGLDAGEIVIRHPSDRIAEGVRVAERP